MIPHLSLPTCRILLFAPHPDDEVLSVGGFLQQALSAGADVSVVFLTNGDANIWPMRLLERRWNISSRVKKCWGICRRREARKSISRLGIQPQNACFLGWKDLGLMQHLEESAENSIERLLDIMEKTRPDLVLSPASFDLHADHNTTWLLLRFVFARWRAAGFCIDEWHYLTHGRGRPGLPVGHKVLLTPKQIAVKCAAIGEHRTQLLLSRRRFLEYAGPEEALYSPAMQLGSHPITLRATSCDTITMELPRAAVVRFVPSRLVLFGAHHAQPLSAVNLGVVPLVEGLRGSQSVVRCQGDRVVVQWNPPFALTHGVTLWAKLVHGFRFHDETGWREMRLENDPPQFFRKTVESGGHERLNISLHR